jgi:hypothetical protein
MKLPQHLADAIRALCHASPGISEEAMLEELILSCDPWNVLDCMESNYEPGTPEFQRLAHAGRVSMEMKNRASWEEFQKTMANFPAYRHQDYPVATPGNIIPMPSSP